MTRMEDTCNFLCVVSGNEVWLFVFPGLTVYSFPVSPCDARHIIAIKVAEMKR